MINKKIYSTYSTQIILNDKNITNEDIAPLKHMHSIKAISIIRTKISDFCFLEKHPCIEYLSIDCGEYYTTNDLVFLKTCTRINAFFGNNLIIKDLSQFKKMKQLKTLSLTYDSKCPNKISDISDIKYLVNLETLRIDCSEISDISNLKYCKNLKNITFYNIDIQDYSVLNTLNNLEYLFIDKNKLSKEQLLILQEKNVHIVESES